MAEISTLYKVDNGVLTSPDRSVINFDGTELDLSQYISADGGITAFTIPAAAMQGIKRLRFEAQVNNQNVVVNEFDWEKAIVGANNHSLTSSVSQADIWRVRYGITTNAAG
jgi:hypothetical protein